MSTTMTESEKKVRVCFVSPKAYPIFNPDVQSVFGGAEVDLYLLATELAKDDEFDVRFVVADYGQPDREVRENVILFKSLNVTGNYISQGHKVWSALRRADAQIYMHEACSLGTTLVALFCRIYHRRFVYRTAHSRETNGTYIRENRFRGLFVKWAFSQANPLLTQNEEDKINLHNTVRLSSIVIKNACRIPSETTEKNNSILWIARSLPIKRPDLFLKLARQIPEQSFVMICPQGTHDANYEQLVTEARTIDNIEFIKQVPFQQIDTFFEKASVFVCTSDSEGFPNTFVQSCKAGTAILSLNVNPDGFLDRHLCGFCAEGNWDLFVATLKEWVASSQAEILGANGLTYIKSHHDITTIIDEYKKIFLGVYNS